MDNVSSGDAKRDQVCEELVPKGPACGGVRISLSEFTLSFINHWSGTQMDYLLNSITLYNEYTLDWLWRWSINLWCIVVTYEWVKYTVGLFVDVLQYSQQWTNKCLASCVWPQRLMLLSEGPSAVHIFSHALCETLHAPYRVQQSWTFSNKWAISDTATC